MNKVEFFFRLLRGLYGNGKIQNAWPTDLDLQLAQKLWADDINRHTEQELRGAIDNAKKQIAKGEDDFGWPNIGVILSGAKGASKNSEYVENLLAYTEDAAEKEKRIAYGKQRIAEIKNNLFGEPHSPTPLTAEQVENRKLEIAKQYETLVEKSK